MRPCARLVAVDSHRESKRGPGDHGSRANTRGTGAASSIRSAALAAVTVANVPNTVSSPANKPDVDPRRTYASDVGATASVTWRYADPPSVDAAPL